MQAAASAGAPTWRPIEQHVPVGSPMRLGVGGAGSQLPDLQPAATPVRSLCCWPRLLHVWSSANMQGGSLPRAPCVHHRCWLGPAAGKCALPACLRPWQAQQGQQLLRPRLPKTLTGRGLSGGQGQTWSRSTGARTRSLKSRLTVSRLFRLAPRRPSSPLREVSRTRRGVPSHLHGMHSAC